jgi:pyrroline-5-carboxylate reductase
MERIGFLGLGVMGSALLKGLLDGGVNPEAVVASDTSEAKLRQFSEKYGIEAALNARGVAEAARILFVAVKPQDIKGLLYDMAPGMRDGHVVVSIAAGVPISDIQDSFEAKVGVIRVMPNTPCLVGEGAICISVGKHVREDDLDHVAAWLGNLGIVRNVPEDYMNAVTGLSGSGPAFVYMMIESMADGGVLAGLPRSLALELATQTVFGAAKMVMETGEHPAILREMVTSPGGTSAAGLFAMEEAGFRAAVQRAVRDAAVRSKELGE